MKEEISELVKAQSAAKRKMQIELCAAIKKILKVKRFSMSYAKRSVSIDGHVVRDIDVDVYSNLSCEIPEQFPVKYLPLFGRVIEELIMIEVTYPRRATCGLYIEFYKQFSKSIYNEELCQMMLDWKKESPSSYNSESSFEEWLIGTSYSSDGNVGWDSPYTKAEIIAMRPKRGEELGEYLHIV